MVKPEDFYSDTPPGRVMGGENELDVQLRYHDADGRPLPHEQVRDRSIQSIIRLGAAGLSARDGRSGRACVLIDIRQKDAILQAWTDNGAKIYQDCGFLEYSGQEVTDPRAAAAAEFAGPSVVAELLDASGVDHEGVFQRTGSIKYSGHGEHCTQRQLTNGLHRNFLIPTSLRRTAGKYLPDSLATVTAISAFAWNGTLGPDGYEWSQKHRGISKKISENMLDRAGQGNKPLVMLRNTDTNLDYDVNPDSRWTRVEQRALDAPHSRSALFLAYALPTLTLRLNEHLDISQPYLDRLLLDEPVRALHQLACSRNLEPVFRTTDDRYLTADNLLEGYAEASQHLADRIELPEGEQAAVPLLFQAAELQRGVRHGDITSFAVICDAARKLCFLRERYTKQPLDYRYAAACVADLTYDKRIRPGKPLDRAGFGIALASHTRRYAEIDEALVPMSMVDYYRHNGDQAARSSQRAAYVASRPRPGYMNWSGYGPSYTDSEDVWPQPYRQADMRHADAA